MKVPGATPPASYLLTFRDDDGARRPLLEAVLAWLASLDTIEVVLVEQDALPRIDKDVLPFNVRYLFAENPGPFNKSWGLNVAARQAREELLVTGDADMIMAGDALGRAILVCAEHFDAVNPYAHLVDLDERQTRSYLRGELSLASLRPHELLDRRPAGEHICFCGGICVYRRSVYFDLGGMDERFLGWGAEDDAMSTNLQRYTERLAVQRDTVAYHLWHPRLPERYTHDHYRENLALARDYATCDAGTLARRRTDQRKSMGDARRFCCHS